jgi:hypothetical protein
MERSAYPKLDGLSSRCFDIALSVQVHDDPQIIVSGPLGSLRSGLAETLNEQTGYTVNTNFDAVRWQELSQRSAVDYFASTGVRISLPSELCSQQPDIVSNAMRGAVESHQTDTQ